MNNPFFNGSKCGARFTWHVIGRGDYSPQIASITGIERKIDFNGGLQSPQITVVLGGAGLWAGDAPGDDLAVTLTSETDNATISLGTYRIIAIDTLADSNGQKLTTITAQGIAAASIKGDYNFYCVTAEDPRALVVNWLKAADQAGILGSLTAPSYRDNGAHREYARVAAPASTLNGLAGFIQDPGVITTSVRAGNEQDTSTWPNTWYSATGIEPCTDVQWTAAPGYSDNRSACGQNPLFMHKKGRQWEVRWTGRETFPATAAQRCQFCLGAIQGLFLSLWQYTDNNDREALSLQNPYYQAAETKDIEITFKSRKEAADFYRQNATHKPPAGYPQTWGWSTYVDGTETQIKRWGGSKTVKFTNIMTYTGITASFYTDARANLAPAAPVLSFAPADDLDMGELTACTDPSVDINHENQTFISALKIQFIPQRMDTLWQQAGITSADTLKQGYQIKQNLKPITIAQEYTTQALMQQAAFLGSLGLYSGDTVELVDTCPESGQVFARAMKITDVSEVTAAGEYPMPSAFNLTFRDPNNTDRTYTVTNHAGTGEAAGLDILQGSVQGWQRPIASGGNDYISFSSIIWGDNPGGLADRLTGSYRSGNDLAGFYTLSTPFVDYGAIWIKPDGGSMPQTTNFSNLSALANYAVRGADDQNYSLFYQGYIGVDNPLDGGKNADPYLDGYPLYSFLRAHAACFADNLNRRSWRVKATMTFASINPGDILGVELPQIFEGQKFLALVVSISIETGGFPEIEFIPMHKITADDYSNFSNLSNVI